MTNKNISSLLRQIGGEELCDSQKARRLTGKSRSCIQLNRVPSRPPATDTRKMKGSWLNHSALLSSDTPLNDRTPFFHLQTPPTAALLSLQRHQGCVHNSILV